MQYHSIITQKSIYKTVHLKWKIFNFSCDEIFQPITNYAAWDLRNILVTCNKVLFMFPKIVHKTDNWPLRMLI